MIDYITVTEEEIADGEYTFSVVAFDADDREVEAHTYTNLSAAADKAYKLGATVDFDIQAASYARL